MAQFMILIRGGNDEALDEYTPEQFQRIIQPYIDWSQKLRREGKHRAGQELKNGGSTLRARNGQIMVDGPYAETKEAVGGFFLIEADDEAEAIEIAKGCPSLQRGGVIELREVNEH